MTDMTKFEFLQQLYDHLSSLPPSERDDIVADFEEHFQVGEEQGKTEEQICTELGNPYACALQYLRGTGGGNASAPQTATQNTAAVQPPYPQNTAASPRPQNAAPAPHINERRNKTLWKVVFFISLVCAIGAYPAACGLMLIPLALIVSAFFLIPAVPGGAMVGFLISLGVLCLTGGLLLFLVMTWLLRLSLRRSGL